MSSVLRQTDPGHMPISELHDSSAMGSSMMNSTIDLSKKINILNQDSEERRRDQTVRNFHKRKSLSFDQKQP